MSYTPGAWTQDRNTIKDQQEQEIATVSYRQDGYVQANARLVAAAPELLAACLALCDAVAAHEQRTGHHQMHPAIDQARAAIAKAEGVQP